MNETLPPWRLCAARPAPFELPDHAADSVTGLPPREIFCQALHRRIAEPPQGALRFAVLALGPTDPEIAESLLGAAARRLRRAIRAGDLAARISDTGFGVLLPRISAPREAEAAARRLIGLMGVPFLLPDSEVASIWRIGLAAYPADGHDPEALLACAEEALARALASRSASAAALLPEPAR